MDNNRGLTETEIEAWRVRIRAQGAVMSDDPVAGDIASAIMFSLPGPERGMPLYYTKNEGEYRARLAKKCADATREQFVAAFARIHPSIEFVSAKLVPDCCEVIIRIVGDDAKRERGR